MHWGEEMKRLVAKRQKAINECKPCPFCGQTLLRMKREQNADGDLGIYIWCTVCGGRTGSHGDLALAIDAWERRQ